MTLLIGKRHAALSNRLRLMVRDAKTEELQAYLKSLSHADFRTASTLLADDILVEACSDPAFWHIFTEVVPTHPKAFLGTFLKAAQKRYMQGHLKLELSAELERFAAQASTIDCRKVLEAFLPQAKQKEEVDCLLRLFVLDSTKERVNALLRVETDVAYYRLFQELRTIEGDAHYLRQIGIKLMQKHTPHAFNMASIIQSYFDLEPLPGSFSLSLKPYELSQLEQSEETFMKILKR